MADIFLGVGLSRSRPCSRVTDEADWICPDPCLPRSGRRHRIGSA